MLQKNGCTETAASSRIPKYKSEMLTKFINMVMTRWQEVRRRTHRLWCARAPSRQRTGQGEGDESVAGARPDALDNVKPAVEVKSRRVGGATYQVPIEVRPTASPDLGHALGDRRRVQAAARSRWRSALPAS